ncbi:hypothetical protein [Micromonospora sp. NPDC050200]|uniref:hypothetical protein n=1 Tax=Micromonospora sp. NPDC050200 TaxID=3155664 RepID=UPI0033C58F74
MADRVTEGRLVVDETSAVLVITPTIPPPALIAEETEPTSPGGRSSTGRRPGGESTVSADPAATRTPRAAYHHLLSRLADSLPDELLLNARDWVAQGRLVDVAQAVGFAIATGLCFPSEEELALLRGTLLDAALDPTCLDQAVGGKGSWWALAPVGPAVLAECRDRLAYSLDLTVPHDPDVGVDDLDTAAIVAARGRHNVAGLWRAWRFPAIDTPWPPPRRIYLLYIDVSTDDQLAHIAASVGRSLAPASTGPAPMVEVFTDVTQLPGYQRVALSAAALLWTREPSTPPLVAATANTPGDRPRQLDPALREMVLSYLDGGIPLALPGAEAPEGQSPAGGPMGGWFTDGHWIWSTAISDRLRVHDEAPQDDLVRHISERDGIVPEVDPISLHRALSTLYGLPWLNPT